MLIDDRKLPLCLVLLVILLGNNAYANTLCVNGNENSAIAATTPTADFSDNGDGTVTHHKTGLIWQRCSLGQSWDGTNCTGDAMTFIWADALAAAAQNTFAGLSDWRLPNKNELASIVEYRCWNPAINSLFFLNTPSALYWSSSAYANSSRYAWGVSFYGVGSSHSSKSDYYHVRLVRDAN